MGKHKHNGPKKNIKKSAAFARLEAFKEEQKWLEWQGIDTSTVDSTTGALRPEKNTSGK